MDINHNEFNHLIHHRRSVFPNMYTTEVVKVEIINQILENANWAPSNKLTCPWRFCVFAGEGLKKLAAFHDLQAQQEKMRDVFISLTSEVGRNYIDLRNFQNLIKLFMNPSKFGRL